ncbi:MAG TPA: helix-turn-helix domain-containing protein [Pyrinomonadaceae bacterium]|jgi:transcriptional regulator with GAF, ATPase, and Fis domain
MEEITLREQQENTFPGGAQPQAANENGDLRQRAQVLKDLALALLSEVQTLGDNQEMEGADGIDFYDEVRRFEIELIQRALKKTGGHQMRAARLLNVKVTTLNSKIKRYHISPTAQLYNYPTLAANVEELRRRA